MAVIANDPRRDEGEMTADVLVLGGGPGGYVAAIRAAQLGAKVVLVEQDKLGGTCLNRGCIPTKSLLHSSEYCQMPALAAKVGVNLQFAGLDVKKLVNSKDQVVAQLVRGINSLLVKNKIRLISGKGRLLDKNTVAVETSAGVVRQKAKRLILATGSKSAVLPVPGAAHPAVINSDQALLLKTIPRKIVIVGGGAVGIEFAYIYRNLGAEVAIVEMMPHLLPQMDGDVVAVLEKAMQQRGIAIYKNTRVERIEESRDGMTVTLSNGKELLQVSADQVLAATGRIPNTEGLDLSAAGVKSERGRIPVDRRMATNVEGIYAIGDVTGGVLLAHCASAEGMVAAENALGQDCEMDYRVVPGCIYSVPEVAGVGLTEQQAREQGWQVKVGKFPFAALGKAVAIDATAGLAKIVADEKYGEILGVHLVGERATDVIAEAALAIRQEVTLESLAATIHAHPTIAESLFEAAHAVHGRAIHLP